MVKDNYFQKETFRHLSSEDLVREGKAVSNWGDRLGQVDGLTMKFFLESQLMTIGGSVLAAIVYTTTGSSIVLIVAAVLLLLPALTAAILGLQVIAALFRAKSTYNGIIKELEHRRLQSHSTDPMV